jgi:hypothetical protein
MPGSYEDIEKAEHRGYDEAPYINIPPSPIIPHTQIRLLL